MVTGGAVRIGRAICLALAQRGCGVVVHYHRSDRAAHALAEELNTAGARASTVGGRLNTQRECEQVLGRAADGTGHLNVLVNNASIFRKTPLADCDEAAVMAELSTNLLAPLFLCRAFAAHLAESSPGKGIRGKIVNLLDRRVRGVEPGCVPYLLSKKALADFTKIAALELAPAVTVNGVAPGAILAPTGPDGQADGGVTDYAGTNPLGRQCSAEDVATAVCFALEFDALTGQVIFVDAGQHLSAS